jgi:maleylpyruvate isomerase
MMKLYNFFASSTSYRTRIVLNYKSIPYEYISVRLDKAEQLGAPYGEINPMRGVPTLDTGEKRLYQSSAIIEYLEEVYPEPPMLPKDPLGRARVRAIAGIVGSDMHPVTNLRIRNFVRDEYRQNPDGVNAWIHRWNRQGFDAIEAMLNADKQRVSGFCHGSTATIADAYLVSHVFSAVRFKTDMSPYPLIGAVVANCEQLEAFARAHPARQPDANPAR